jgi:HKD family nuclease
MKLVSNISECHLEKLEQLIGSAKSHVILVSPYLASDLKSLLAKFDFSKTSDVWLVTTLKPNDPEQLTKPKQLLDFLEYFESEYPKVKVALHIDNSLHGKIYMIDPKANGRMIVTSANLTLRGMTKNHEWGIDTGDIAEVRTCFDEIYGSVEYEDVSLIQIRHAVRQAEVYKKQEPDWTKPAPQIHTDILNSVYSVPTLKVDEARYFLKPIGSSENPIELVEQRNFSEVNVKLSFAKRPNSVRRGDILITTAIGAGCILSYYQAIGSLDQETAEKMIQDPHAARWKWFFEGRNLSPSFGSRWWEINLGRKDVLADFLRENPNSQITYNKGANNLESIRYGADKIQLSEQFGKYLTDRIDKYSIQ